MSLRFRMVLSGEMRCIFKATFNHFERAIDGLLPHLQHGVSHEIKDEILADEIGTGGLWHR